MHGLYFQGMRASSTTASEAEQAIALFDALPDVEGRTDHDFHPPALAAHYVAEDERVMRSGPPLREQAWLVPDHTGLPAWYRCTKLPLFDRAGRVSGLAGILRPFAHGGQAPEEYQRLTPALRLVASGYDRPIRVSELATACGPSVSHLQREFSRLFGMSPSDYVLRTRLLLARRMLDQTAKPVGEVAVACGFYDQSHFTKAFKAHTGLPPQAYRRRTRDVRQGFSATTLPSCQM
jgi:AraC-like DNA-binding protein